MSSLSSFFDFLFFLFRELRNEWQGIDTKEEQEKEDNVAENFFLEEKIQESGWVHSATRLPDALLIDVIKSHYDWSEAYGNIDLTNQEVTIDGNNFVEINLEKEERKEQQHDVFPWTILLVNAPLVFPADQEILIIFGDKLDGTRNKPNRQPISLSQENVIRCTNQSVYAISSLINRIKPRYNHRFVVVYRKFGEQRAHFVRVCCDERDIGFLWMESANSISEHLQEENKMRLRRQGEVLVEEEHLFAVENKFMVFQLYNPNESQDMRANLVILNENCLWAKQKKILFHIVVKK
jgi:hypothetical protein